MTVQELLSKASGSELTEWAAFFETAHFGSELLSVKAAYQVDEQRFRPANGHTRDGKEHP